MANAQVEIAGATTWQQAGRERGEEVLAGDALRGVGML